MRLLTKSAALHCAEAKHGIRVNSVHPGYIRTALVEAYFQEIENGAEEKVRKLALYPVGQSGEPEPRFMTGAELVIDGGYTAQ